MLDFAGAPAEEEPVAEGLEVGGHLEGEDGDEEGRWHNSLGVPDLMIKG